MEFRPLREMAGRCSRFRFGHEEAFQEKAIRLLRGRGEAADRDEREVLIEEEMRYQRLYPRHIGSG